MAPGDARRRRGVLAVAALALLAGSMAAGAEHTPGRVLDRFVAPTGQQEITFVPILAGYEPVPTPMHCGPGLDVPGTIYAEDFEGGAHGWTLDVPTKLAPTHTSLWSVLDPGAHATAPPGPDVGHSQPHRLYFGLLPGNAHGRPAWTTGGTSWTHVAGTAESPPVQLPAEGQAALVFGTKWSTECLRGYDHLWVEMRDAATGRVHLLCTANAYDRADPVAAAASSVLGSCSPYHLGPCPGQPLARWEQRSAPVPAALMGKVVHVRFTYDSSDPVANQHMGWMVDDVRIRT